MDTNGTFSKFKQIQNLLNEAVTSPPPATNLEITYQNDHTGNLLDDSRLAKIKDDLMRKRKELLTPMTVGDASQTSHLNTIRSQFSLNNNENLLRSIDSSLSYIQAGPTPISTAQRDATTPYFEDKTYLTNKSNQQWANESSLLSILNKSSAEELCEAKLRPEERLFQDTLYTILKPTSLGLKVGCRVEDCLSQAGIAGQFAQFTEFRRRAAEEEHRRVREELAMSSLFDSQDIILNQHNREVEEYRAERDLWSLLNIVTRAELLHDVDEFTSERNLESAIMSCENIETYSIPALIHTSFEADKCLKKGLVIKEWLESCATDLVFEVPVSRDFPWSNTLDLITLVNEEATAYSKRRKSSTGNKTGGVVGSPNSVSSIHPDAQLSYETSINNDVKLLEIKALEGDDAYDQELILKYIWQLIRSGQMKKAQEAAVEHQLYWLAGSIFGIQNHYYEDIACDQGEGQGQGGGDNSNYEFNESFLPATQRNMATVRRGNIRKSLWLNTCLNYSNKIAENPRNLISSTQRQSRTASSSTGTVGMLEMSIYAALSNNIKTLLEKSSLLTTWTDKLWALMKCIHERDIFTIIHKHRLMKKNYSDLFPDCDDKSLQVEQKLLKILDDEVGRLSCGSCVELFKKLPPPATKSVESSLLRLQASIISGHSAISKYINAEIIPFLTSKDGCGIKGDTSRLYRVYCHFLLWLKFSASDSGDMSDLVTETSLHLAVESYVNNLIRNKQRSVVAPYLCFLTKQRRIAKYVELLHSLQFGSLTSSSSSSVSTIDSDEAILLFELANSYFPCDLNEIISAVIEIAKFPSIEVHLPFGTFKSLESIISAARYNKSTMPSNIAIVPTSVSKYPMAPPKSASRISKTNATSNVRFLAPIATEEESSSITPKRYSISSATPIDNDIVTSTALTTPFRREKGSASTPGPNSLIDVRFNESSQSIRNPSSSSSSNPLDESHAYVEDTDHLAILASTNWTSEYPRFITTPSYIPAISASEKSAMIALIGSEDVARLDSIKWLLIAPVLPSYSLLPLSIDNISMARSNQYAMKFQALKQANRFLNRFYLETKGRKSSNANKGDSLGDGDKLLQIKLLLHKYLPDDIVESGHRELFVEKHGNLTKILEELDDEYDNEGAGGGGGKVSTSVNIARRQEIEDILDFDRKSFDVEFSLFVFWKSYLKAMECIGAFEAVIREFDRVKSRLLGSTEILKISLGRYESSIGKAAEAAMNAIVSCIGNQEDSSNNSMKTSFSSGVTDVWQSLHMLSYESIDRTLAMADLDIKSSHQNSSSNISSSKGNAEAIELLTSNLNELKRTVSTGEAIECSSCLHTFNNVTEDLGGKMDRLEKIANHSLLFRRGMLEATREKEDVLVDILTRVISSCRSDVVDINEANQILPLVAFKLLRHYSKICGETASAYQTISAPTKAIILWNQRSLHLANIIASSSPFLKLYEVLNRNDLEILLQEINKAAMRNLSLENSFSMGN